MATLGNNVKVTVLKGLEALGKTAAGLGTAAQQKLSEINVEARRGELRKQIPGVALELWKEGVELPEKLNVVVQELGELEEKLAAMRARPDPAKEEPEAEEKAEAADDGEEAAPESEDADETPQTEAWTEGLEKAAHCAGEVIGNAMDAVGCFMESAADKVGEAIESLKKREDEASVPQDDQPQEPCDAEAADNEEQPQETSEDEGTGDNA